MARIQSSYGTQSITYLEVGEDIQASDWCVNTRLAAFKVIDVLLTTSMKDGSTRLLPGWRANLRS